MMEISTEILISATPEKIWKILEDIDSWQEWSPVINYSSGSAAVGSQVDITMCSKEEGKDGPKYSPVITRLEEPRFFSWKATMFAGFVFTNEKIFTLEKTSSGTRVVHKETFSGLMVLAMGKQMEKGVPPMLNAMNEALKQKAEQGKTQSA